MRPAFLPGTTFSPWAATALRLAGRLFYPGSLMILVAHTAWQRRQLLKSVRQHQARERRIRAAK